MIHQPTPNEIYDVELISNGYEPPGTNRQWRPGQRPIRRWRKLYKITGNMDGKPIEGEMSIYLIRRGEFDGYDWNGTKLNEDEKQSLLNLFADEI